MSEELMGLVAKWRGSASRLEEKGLMPGDSLIALGKRNCADDLAALLAKPEAAGALAGEVVEYVNSRGGRITPKEYATLAAAVDVSDWRPLVYGSAALSAAPVAAQQPETEQSIKADAYDMIAEALESRGVRVSSIVDHVTGRIAQQPAVVGDGEPVPLLHDLRMSLASAIGSIDEYLSAPTPAATPVPLGGEDERLCKYCGSPTMHMGDICFACGKAAKRLALAHPPQDGRKGEDRG